MNRKEKNLSSYIDSLNAEKMPVEHRKRASSPRQEKLYETARLVRSLKEPVMPDESFGPKLVVNTSDSLAKNGPATNIKRPVKNIKSKVNNIERPVMKSNKKWYINATAAAVVILAVIAFNFFAPFNKGNVALAMEQAYADVKAYHGIIEVAETNAEGQRTLQSKIEVWADKEGRYYLKGLEGPLAGMATANNGKEKWQLRSAEKKAYTFPAFPDPYRFTFELGKEVENVKNALKSETKGEESVSGRKATVLEVKPDGGIPYSLWVDKETKLPLKKQSSIQNAIQYTAEYTEIDFIDSIPTGLTAFSVPVGYTKVSTNPEQAVSNLTEAKEITGFMPKVPEKLPSDYKSNGIAIETMSKSVKLSYISNNSKAQVIVLEKKTSEEFKPAASAALGKVGGSTAEFQSPIQDTTGILGGRGAYGGVAGIVSIRWQKAGFEYVLLGDAPEDILIEFVQNLGFGKVLKPEKQKTAGKPQVEVPVDMAGEENEQKSVDAGHSPWKLDPTFVAQVFVSLKISPQGIQGEYPIKYEDMKVILNTGTDAEIEVAGKNTPVRRVYLKKLIRQDSTGIWTVVGYDPA